MLPKKWYIFLIEVKFYFMIYLYIHQILILTNGHNTIIKDANNTRLHALMSQRF